MNQPSTGKSTSIDWSLVGTASQIANLQAKISSDMMKQMLELTSMMNALVGATSKAAVAGAESLYQSSMAQGMGEIGEGLTSAATGLAPLGANKAGEASLGALKSGTGNSADGEARQLGLHKVENELMSGTVGTVGESSTTTPAASTTTLTPERKQKLETYRDQLNREYKDTQARTKVQVDVAAQIPQTVGKIAHSGSTVVAGGEQAVSRLADADKELMQQANKSTDEARQQALQAAQQILQSNPYDAVKAAAG